MKTAVLEAEPGLEELPPGAAAAVLADTLPGEPSSPSTSRGEPAGSPESERRKPRGWKAQLIASAEAASAARAAGIEVVARGDGRFAIKMEKYEGPLDLLLALIQKHEIDIFDLPIAFITEKYLAHLAVMKALDLDVAGEFLLMAATLAHIKSRMLLPRPEPEAEQGPEEDPREALVRRLLEYQKYKQAAEDLGARNLLGRDVFVRRAPPPKVVPAEGDLGLAEVSVFKLVEALDRTLKAARIVIPHEVMVERISVADRISELVDQLKEKKELSFFALFGLTPGGARLAGAPVHLEKGRIVATFLAILEMARLKLIRVRQVDADGDILITATGDGEGAKVEGIDDYA